MSRAPARLCRVPSCGNRLPAGYLVCPSCWRAAPRSLKAEFRAAHRRGDRVAFLAACDAIIAAAGRSSSPLLPEPA